MKDYDSMTNEELYNELIHNIDFIFLGKIDNYNRETAIALLKAFGDPVDRIIIPFKLKEE